MSTVQAAKRQKISHASPGPASPSAASSSSSDGSDVENEETGLAEDAQVTKTFKDLGVVDTLAEACATLKYEHPTQIQAESIPVALQGKDIVGLAETGSGKTAAFALPILQKLLDNPQPFYSLVLAPTRELAFQIGKTFEALGAIIRLRVCTIVGGMEFTPQQIALGKKPHIIVATPGRILDHMERTKGFNLRNLKYLVLDEADRLLELEFGPVIEKILKFLPRERNTFLFSATMSSKVESLQRASLRDPVRISVKDTKYQTVKTLITNYVFIPHKHKDTYLIYLMAVEFTGRSAIIFTRTVNEAQRLAILLRTLGLGAIPLHGQLSQSNRLGALNKFKTGNRNMLVATDVAARGLDIPNVDIVVNYDLPGDSKTYVHRVGRTARAGKSGRALNLVTQYDVEVFQRIEWALGDKQVEYPTEREDVMVFKARVEEAQRHARNEMKNLHADRDSGRKGATLKGRHRSGPSAPGGKGGKRRRDDMDAEEG
ncbi:ATP-dependent rRNA helicase RRP3 [Diaporthe sp. PMI_573]|nr:ATP-dependent rRNA helicase RRP3 [Diaporthaceae sp. PMI_573]